MEYKIIKSIFITRLEITVNSLIKVGWEPIGGVSYDSKGDKFLQAIIKKQ